ncbi:glycosyltransferase involved in cell wall biosynthesis [Flavobacterium nitrogenifigens]|uniref:Glycosyltransferase involved in cell wall biosynthesis n=2 Tax=Flavobacterium TaxID=237 RepID=A0A7W7N742_9FLAO|nr:MULTISPECIES: glycosyltransferase [Flavobacterium]MBB4802505.1 glycosyltransferase involved in cell wall biosynthesis [Flavobacterium nitrogenifigens]MBB6387463.1 glycosyltransferase involved in cell wall biosynthesis [Flavobacterium notoginsengisoli]
MKIILFAHPSFLKHQSMPRYANMLQNGMIERGHEVEVWSPKARFYKIPSTDSLKKWLGYIDQYLIFPIEVKFKLINSSKENLFVFADQALGPWVPLVKNRKHVVHCHDFLALKSALGMIPENPTSRTGKWYQDYIRKGFSKGKNFISISKKTQQDLHELHLGKIENSAVCYNGLNRTFCSEPQQSSRDLLQKKLNIDLSKGYIMHIGGNQYYKNRKGVMEIYETWRNLYNVKIPLILIGEEPSDELAVMHLQSSFKNDIHFISNLSDEYINNAYSGASCLLFPSLDEGFGWPIIEAMASGCPVITTDKAPMNEIGGIAAYYIAKRPVEKEHLQKWKTDGAEMVQKVLTLEETQQEENTAENFSQSQKFTMENSLNAIEVVYKQINQIV